MSNYKIVVFHPMQQHSFQTATALKKGNILYQYWTSVYYQPKKLIYRLMNIFLSNNEKKKMHSRFYEPINNEVECFCTFYGMLFLITSRIDKTKSKYFKLKSKDILIKKIGKKVAKKAIKENVDYIISYDTWSYGLIKELKRKKSDIKVIMDCSSLYGEEINEIMKADINNNYSNIGSYKNILEQFSKKYINKFRYEKDNTDYFFSPSTVVDKSFIKYGINKKQIFRCTYGSYFKHIDYKKKKKSNITFIYIGRLSYAKGVHYLIKAFDDLKRNDYQLLLVGADTDDIAKTITNKNIKVLGVVSHDKIPSLLDKSDVIISASLFDGFSLALLEGAAYNLPILCTTSNGASDYIINGINGYKFQSLNSSIISKYVNSILDDKNCIDSMSKNIGKIVENLTWDNYYNDVINAINNIINKENKNEE